MLNVVVVYLVSTALVAALGGPVRGGLPLALALSAWAVPNLIAVVGMLRSAFRALARWRDDRLQFVGALLAVSIVCAAAYLVQEDMRMLLR